MGVYMSLYSLKKYAFLSVGLIVATQCLAADIDYIKTYVDPKSFLREREKVAQESNFFTKQLFYRNFLKLYQKINNKFKQLETLNSKLSSAKIPFPPGEISISFDHADKHRLNRQLCQTTSEILNLTEQAFQQGKGMIIKGRGQFEHWLAIEHVKVAQAIDKVLKGKTHPDFKIETEAWERYLKAWDNFEHKAQ